MRHEGLFYVLVAMISALGAAAAGRLAWLNVPNRVQYVLVVLLMVGVAATVFGLWLVLR